MKFSSFLVLFLVWSTGYSQDLRVFYLSPLRNDTLQKVGFVNLSDENLPFEIYKDTVHDDDIEEELIPENEYVVLTGNKRSTFLNSLNISEAERIYIYSMYLDKVFTFPVGQVELIERPNLYMGTEIGFKVLGLPLKSMGYFQWNTFVCIGKSNLFSPGNAYQIKWEEADSSSFPDNLKGNNHQEWYDTFPRGKVFHSSVNGYKYLVQNLNSTKYKSIAGRHLIVYKNSIDSLIFNQVYMDTESTSPSPLTSQNEGYQWTGKIFKNKPSIVYGFQWVSFGCPWIDFFGGQVPSISIYCDNRH